MCLHNAIYALEPCLCTHASFEPLLLLALVKLQLQEPSYRIVSCRFVPPDGWVARLPSGGRGKAGQGGGRARAPPSRCSGIRYDRLPSATTTAPTRAQHTHTHTERGMSPRVTVAHEGAPPCPLPFATDSCPRNVVEALIEHDWSSEAFKPIQLLATSKVSQIFRALVLKPRTTGGAATEFSARSKRASSRGSTATRTASRTLPRSSSSKCTRRSE